jgi:hypothetical protein
MADQQATRRAYAVALVFETDRQLDQYDDFERIDKTALASSFDGVGDGVEFVSGLYEVEHNPAGDYDVRPQGDKVRGYVGDDPHEVNHTWTNDGTGHCAVCGAISADMEARPLRFYDHARQAYAATAPSDEVGDFMLGDYLDGGCVGEGGEFRVVLVDLADERGLSPQLRAFGDGLGSLKRAIAVGLLDALAENVESTDAFSRRLIDLGLVDRSDTPLVDDGRQR